MRNGVDALIYATIMTRKVEVPAQLYKARVPVVLLNCYSDDRHFPSVCPGEVAGGHRATETLVRAGHRRIAIITGEMWMDAARDRLRGYRQALATADIAYDPALVREGNWQTSAGYEQTQTLMKLKHPPTAIFCSNDRMAVGCYEALKERGLLDPRRRLGGRLRRRGGRAPPLAAAHHAGAAAPRDGTLGDRTGAGAGRQRQAADHQARVPADHPRLGPRPRLTAIRAFADDARSLPGVASRPGREGSTWRNSRT